MVGKGSKIHCPPPKLRQKSIYGWMSVAAVIALFITAVTFLFITNDLDEKVMPLPAPIARIENEDDKTESESLANTSSQVIKNRI